MRIIPRDEWGARHGDGRYWTELPATEVWLHHSVTIAPDLVPPFNDDDAAIRTVERIGTERFGSAYGFPYSFGITPVGRIYGGHHISKTGAHTAGRNTRGRAIVFVGNYDTVRPTEAMLDAAAWLLIEGQRRGWWRHARLNGGHRDVKATACPGRHAYNLISEINRRAAAGGKDTMALSGTQAQQLAQANDQLTRTWDNPGPVEGPGHGTLVEVSCQSHHMLTAGLDYTTWRDGDIGSLGNHFEHAMAARQQLDRIEDKIDQLLGGGGTPNP